MGHNTRQLEMIFKALAYEKRLEILDYVIRYPGKTVTEISYSLNLPIATVSRGLNILAGANLVKVKRTYGYARYRVKSDSPFGQNILLLSIVKQAFINDEKVPSGKNNVFNALLTGKYKEFLDFAPR